MRFRTLPSLAAVSLVAATGVIAACSSTPQPNAALEQARATYNRAAADPGVVDRASLELRQAKAALDEADTMWRDDRDREAVEHSAYVATRRAQVAEETARLKTSQDQASQAAASAGMQSELRARTEQAQAAQDRAREAEQRNAALQQELASMNARQTGGGYVLTLGDILFTTGRAELKPGAAPQLDQLTRFLQHHPDRSVLIEGFTDNTGNPNTNQILSERRAAAVRDALVVRGVPATRVQTRGFGETMPVASNEDAGGRQLNRRVQVVISDPNGAFPGAAG
jgi:outer membrane protein OmpA-like peptidoglycan-associated protein